MKVSLLPHKLKFKFKAGTSRGSLLEHEIWYLIVSVGDVYGVGEIAPLPQLSIDYGSDFYKLISEIDWSNIPDFNSTQDVLDFIKGLGLSNYPSLVFGLETAFLDLLNGGKKKVFECDFYSRDQGIPINGLIWMNTKKHMMNQVEEKLSAGFKCVKMKIGAINIEEELEILASIRERYNYKEIVLRVDANGAFNYNQAKDVLKKLEELDIHSIEQPIAPGQRCFMRTLSQYNRVGVALDEELIGVHSETEKRKLLEEILPDYIILKPTLHGGILSCIEWIDLAREMEIDWWLTSALESNIGLNAVSQLASYLEAENYQGLGTGQLYHNNIDSPLEIKEGYLFYNKTKTWDELN